MLGLYSERNHTLADELKGHLRIYFGPEPCQLISPNALKRGYVLLLPFQPISAQHHKIPVAFRDKFID